MDLAAMLRTLAIERAPGTFVYCTSDRGDLLGEAAATVQEAEGRTLVLARHRAEALGLPLGLELAWLTVQVHSSLEAVGLTAALSRALADAGIPCNVLAGAHHDHLLVPAELADRAMAALAGLRVAS